MIANVQEPPKMEKRMEVIYDMMPSLKKMENGKQIGELGLTIADEILVHIVNRVNCLKEVLDENDLTALLILTCFLGASQLRANSCRLGDEFMAQVLEEMIKK